MSAGILGDVNDGWFAKLAHGCEWMTKTALNAISCGARWGDSYYAHLGQAADAHAASLNERTVALALANGTTNQQALSGGSAAMERLANPANATELAQLVRAGSTAALEGIRSSVTPAPPDFLGLLMPLLIGVGALGATCVVADTLSKGTQRKPSP